MRLAFEMVPAGLVRWMGEVEGPSVSCDTQVDFPYIYDRALRLNPS